MPTVRTSPAARARARQRSRARHLSTEQARQGEIILRKPWQKAVFIAGLAGAALVAALSL
jgi:hypothetical protein